MNDEELKGFLNNNLNLKDDIKSIEKFLKT